MLEIFIRLKKNPQIRVSKVMVLSQILIMQPQFATAETVPEHLQILRLVDINPTAAHPVIEGVLLSIDVPRQDKCISPGPAFSEQTMVGERTNNNLYGRTLP